LIFVERAITKKGAMLTVGNANIYDTQEQVKIVEADHIIMRNIPPPPKPKEETEAPKAEPAPTPAPAAKPEAEAEKKPKEA
jgi:ribosomal protein S24E